MRTRCDQLRRRAFTLIEVVASIMLVSVMGAAALRLVVAARASEVDAAERLRGQQLASMLMAEILAMRFVDPSGPAPLGMDAGESRLASRETLDDVDDYAGLTQSPPRDHEGEVVAGTVADAEVNLPSPPSAWSWSVEVAFAQPVAPTFSSAAATRAKVVTVAVSVRGRAVATRTAVVTPWGGS